MKERLSAIVGAKIKDFQRKMAEVNRIAKQTASKVIKPIDANTREFTRKVLKVKKDIAELNKRVVIRIEAKANKFTMTMDRVAKTIRTFGTVSQNVVQGALTSMFTASIPIISSAGTAIASLGPMLGVVAGGALGLASGLAAAGAGAVGFGAVAIPTLSKVFQAENNIKKAQDELAKADTAKKQKQALEKLREVYDGLSSSQLKAVKSLESFKKFWRSFTKQFQNPVFDIFAKSLSALQNVLKQSQPAIMGTSKAIDGLMSSLNASLKTDDVKAFFNWIGKSAGPAVTAFGKTAGNVLRGIMNIFVAFNPLAQKMQIGLEGMTKSFADWTSGLSKSDKFQTFISYVETNGPKLLKIVGNISSGLVGMFSAFAPTSADMLTGLQNLTARFKAWGQTLSQNKSFQDFIAYVRDNAPKVLTLIGNLVTLISNLAKGMAPLGSKVLDLINGFLSWTNAMLKAHPAIAKVLGVAVSMIGVLQEMIPVIIAWRTAFGGSVSFIIKNATKMGSTIASLSETVALKAMYMRDSIKSFSSQAVTTAKNWAVQTGEMIKQAAVWSAQMVVNFVKVAASAVASVAETVAIWTLMAVEATVNALKVAAAWTLSAGQAMASAVASMVTAAAKFVAQWALMGVQSLIQAAKVAAAWVIAMGPISLVTATVIALVALIIANWNKIKSWTVKIFTAIGSFLKNNWQTILAVVTGPVGNLVLFIIKHWSQIKTITTQVFTAVWSFLKSIWSKTAGWISSKVQGIWSSIKGVWDKVMSFLKGINLFSIGKNIIKGLVNGIGSMAKSLVGKVEGIVGGAVKKAKKLLHIHSPSRVFMQIGQYTGQGMVIGMGKTISHIQNQSQKMAMAAIPSMRGQQVSLNGISNIGSGTVSMPDLSKSSYSLKESQTSNDSTNNQRDSGGYAIINIGGYEAKGFIKYLTEEQQRQEDREERFEG